MYVFRRLQSASVVFLLRPAPGAPLPHSAICPYRRALSQSALVLSQTSKLGVTLHLAAINVPAARRPLLLVPSTDPTDLLFFLHFDSTLIFSNALLISSPLFSFLCLPLRVASYLLCRRLPATLHSFPEPTPPSLEAHQRTCPSRHSPILSVISYHSTPYSGPHPRPPPFLPTLLHHPQHRPTSSPLVALSPRPHQPMCNALTPSLYPHLHW